MSESKILDLPAVIFDNGSGLCKAGLSGEQAPRSVIATVVGYPKSKAIMFGAGHREYYVGEEAQSKRGILSFKYPMEHGIVTLWEDMEKIWWHLFKHELKMKPSERPVLLTEAPLNTVSNREKMAEIMFEGFQVPAIFVALQALMALYASARTTGLVLDSGDGVTLTVPVYKGHCLLHGVSRLDFAGRDITKYLAQLLLETGCSFVSTAEKEIVKDIKEKLCFVAVEPSQKNQEKPNRLGREYILPDGNAIKITDQLFRAPETLFVPANAGIEAPGIDKMILQSVMKCDGNIHPDIMRNVVLSGGSTLFRGLNERLLKELQTQSPSTIPVKLLAPRDRMYSVWIGASVLTSLTSFRDMWVTSEDYKKTGPSVLQRKCF
ncbi:actin-85C-like isoform X1 [Terrapene carolina triunguis]|uniref:actin-85C-like isoform X1 n=2 Tax=Terrapene triunguis TaxID=2587831 RepID=UPI000E77F237|nr:actin-85C-like isoform X1 [Terrapene carolina triunguis]